MDFDNNVLVVSIRNMLYSITETEFHLVFDSYGQVDSLDLFQTKEKDKLQAVIWFRCSLNTSRAKAFLQGRNIYDGCCQMEIEFYSQPLKNRNIEEETTPVNTKQVNCPVQTPSHFISNSSSRIKMCDLQTLPLLKIPSKSISPPTVMTITIQNSQLAELSHVQTLPKANEPFTFSIFSPLYPTITAKTIDSLPPINLLPPQEPPYSTIMKVPEQFVWLCIWKDDAYKVFDTMTQIEISSNLAQQNLSALEVFEEMPIRIMVPGALCIDYRALNKITACTSERVHKCDITVEQEQWNYYVSRPPLKPPWKPPWKGHEVVKLLWAAKCLEKKKKI